MAELQTTHYHRFRSSTDGEHTIVYLKALLEERDSILANIPPADELKLRGNLRGFEIVAERNSTVQKLAETYWQKTKVAR